jgi:Cysteine-rich secretory protein family
MPRHSCSTVGFVLVCLLAVAGAPRADSSTPWLDRVNVYRAMASLPPVVENPRLSRAAFQHARYMVMHGRLRHTESLSDAWFTREGAAAAAVSNIAGSPSPFEPDSWAIDDWMQAPFHALGILDPALQQVGFGIYRAPKGPVQTAAALDVIRGRRAAPTSTVYPVVWPGNGSFVLLTTHTAEHPDPLTSCPGFLAPAGLPLIVQLGPGRVVPRITGSWIAEGARDIDHCIFDQGTYKNPDAAQQRLVRRILASRNAIILIPRTPLRPGARYRAIVEVNRRRIEWTFGAG